MGEGRFFGMPPDEVEKVRSEGRELIPIGRDVPWSVTEEILEACFPDPERRLRVYKSILETLRKESVIPKSFVTVTPERDDPSMTVVDLEAYRKSRQNSQGALD